VTETYYDSPDPLKGQPVLLDSGSTISRLPTPMWQALASSFPTARCDSDNFCDVDCGVAVMNGTVNFGFGSKTIKVSYNDVIWKVPQKSFQRCLLGVVPTESELLASLLSTLAHTPSSLSTRCRRRSMLMGLQTRQFSAIPSSGRPTSSMTWTTEICTSHRQQTAAPISWLLGKAPIPCRC
jgi:hypothetical protein